MDSLIQHGIVPRMPAYSSGPAALPLPAGGVAPTSDLAGATATVTSKVAAAAAELGAAVGGAGDQQVKKAE